jgi:hypothetical protein
MSYTIFTREQIVPATITVHGVDGLETRNNPGMPPVYPVTFTRLICRVAVFNAYSAVPSDRLELWEDTAGTAADSEILTLFPGLRDKVGGEVFTIRKGVAAKISTDNAALLAIYDANRDAAEAVRAGLGDAKARDGSTNTQYLTPKAASHGMTVPAYADWLIAENERIGAMVKRIDDEYERLFYSVIPATTSVATLLALPDQYRGFCA